MYCNLSVELNMREMPHGVRRSWAHFVFAFVSVCVVGKNPNTPQFEPMADDAIPCVVSKVWDLPCISVVVIRLSTLHSQERNGRLSKKFQRRETRTHNLVVHNR